MLPIYKAARAVERSRTYVKDLIEQGHVTAYRKGGPADHPWLEVDVDELRTAIRERSVYVPKRASSPKRPRRRPPGASKRKGSSWVDLMRK